VFSVGNSNKGFDMRTISNLVAFFFALEPQLNSLHPEHRQNQPWGFSMRDASLYVREYRGKYGRQPHPLTGVIHFLKCKSIIEIIKQASSVNPNSDSCFKYNAYNFQGIAHQGIGFGDSKLTVEFRQHAATMDAEAVVIWIETLVGIVDYIRNIDNVSLTNLLQMVEHETWEKLGDGEDDEREARFGPILAESKFTIIDLLEGMELYSSANYYQNRWKKLAKRTPNLRNPKTDIVWEYEDRLDPETDEYKHLHRLRGNWEADRIAFEAQPPGGSWKFQPYHPRWPQHRNIVDPAYDPDFMILMKEIIQVRQLLSVPAQLDVMEQPRPRHPIL
jgi:hypothetical protein